MKFWIQSFLLGVPKIIVGFRSREGILQRLEEIEVEGIPDTVARGRRQWDGNMCINFAAEFLECKLLRIMLAPLHVWKGGVGERISRLTECRATYENRR